MTSRALTKRRPASGPAKADVFESIPARQCQLIGLYRTCMECVLVRIAHDVVISLRPGAGTNSCRRRHELRSFSTERYARRGYVTAPGQTEILCGLEYLTPA